MPYFLVTHTSLVEADDEAAAAAKVYETICDSEKLTFDVKADEHIATKVIIPTRARIETKLADLHSSALPSPETERLAITSQAHDVEGANGTVDQSDGVFRSSGVLFCASVGIVAAFYVLSHLFI
jgi:hypothetical protein